MFLFIKITIVCFCKGCNAFDRSCQKKKCTKTEYYRNIYRNSTILLYLNHSITHYLNHSKVAIRWHKLRLQLVRLQLPLRMRGHRFSHVKAEILPSLFSREPPLCSVFPEDSSSLTRAFERAHEEQICQIVIFSLQYMNNNFNS